MAPGADGGLQVGPAGLELLAARAWARPGPAWRCDGCRWLFVDQSKNRSRRWCAMEDCGTAEKVRRYLTRRAAARR